MSDNSEYGWKVGQPIVPKKKKIESRTSKRVLPEEPLLEDEPTPILPTVKVEKKKHKSFLQGRSLKQFLKDCDQVKS